MQNTNYPYDYIVFILRGQPFTVAHKAIEDYALTMGKKVITVFGSDNRPRTIKNPLLVSERMHAFELVYGDTPEWDRMVVMSASDYAKNSDFVDEVVEMVGEAIWADGLDPNTAKIAITGYSKEGDPSAFYIDMFSKWWDFVPSPVYPLVEGFGEVRATKVREILFDSPSLIGLRGVVPDVVIKYLHEFRQSAEFARLAAERKAVAHFKEKLPSYPILCVTTDALLVCDEYILMIERGGDVGKGLWALPGGFVEENLRIEENLYKELKEESMIGVPVEDLKTAFLGYHIEDNPTRSDRCRIITHVGCFDLTHLGYSRDDLPPVTGGDDAARAFWVHCDNIPMEVCFEDHGMMIDRCLDKFFV